MSSSYFDLPGEPGEFSVLSLSFALHELGVDVVEVGTLPFIPIVFPWFRFFPSVFQQIQILDGSVHYYKAVLLHCVFDHLQVHF